MSYIKQQSDQKTKQKTIWDQWLGLSKKIWYNHISDLKSTKKTSQKY